MEALSAAAARGEAGGSVPFGSPVGDSPAKTGRRGFSAPTDSQPARAPPPGAGASAGAQPRGAQDALPKPSPAGGRPQAVVSFADGVQELNGSAAAAAEGPSAADSGGGGGFSLKEITQAAAQSLGSSGGGGAGSDAASDWGSMDEPFPMTPGGTADHHARLSGASAPPARPPPGKSSHKASASVHRADPCSVVQQCVVEQP